MLEQSVRFIERNSNIPVLLVLTLLAVVFPAVVFPAHGIGDIRLLDLHFSYSSDQVYEHLTALGTAGRRAYTRMALTSDLVFPVIYSSALSVALTLVLRKLFTPASRLRYLCLFPFLIVISDWCENLSLAFVTRAFPEHIDAVVISASAFTSIKWTLIVLTVLMMLLAAVISVACWLGNRL